MGRPRTTNAHLPKYVKVIHGTFWYCPPDQKPIRVTKEDGESARVGDDSSLYRWLGKHLEQVPTGPGDDALRRVRPLHPRRAPDARAADAERLPAAPADPARLVRPYAARRTPAEGRG